jgi:uncharacterized protein YjbI with pentapeptide repeats
LIDGKFIDANLSNLELSRVTACGAIFSGAMLEGMNGRLADFSDSEFRDVQASGACFERTALMGVKIEKIVAERAVFEFADLRGAIMRNSNFKHANFVGASFSGAEAVNCNFEEADFYWAEMENFRMKNCNTKGARFPEKIVIAYGPTGVRPPEIKPVPLYRKAATPEERQKLLKAALEIESILDNQP